jgi:hypothetical protein
MHMPGRRPETALMRHALALATTVAAAGLLAGSASVFGVRAPESPKAAATEPAWTEVKWPFALDQWGLGKAFTCAAADCGTRIDVYVRPKIGYCNCSTGVSDDQELERVSDAELVTASTRARGDGEPIKIGWMYGRSRAYRIGDGNAHNGLLSVAYNDECDVVVALAGFGKGDPATAQRNVISFLGSRPMVLWAKKELGLEFVRRDW